MAIFFITLPLIILYANGYKYNFKKNSLQKTGAIFLETKPKDTSIFLNNNLVEEKIPVLIKNLLPNNYVLKITKTGYTTWDKTVSVKTSQTNFLQYIRLFKNNQSATKLYGGKINNIKYNSTQNILILQRTSTTSDRLIWFDIDNQKAKNIIKSPDKINNFELIEKGRWVLVTTTHKNWLINLDNKMKYDINKIIGEPAPLNLKVSIYNANYWYYENNRGLYSYNLINKQKQLLLQYKPLDYLVANNALYYLNHNSLNKIFLNKINLSNNETQNNILDLALADSYKILNVANEFITIKNQDNNSLTIFNLATGMIEKIGRVLHSNWNNQHNELLYNTHNELWILKPQKKQNKYLLLTRTSKPLQTGVWYAVSSHIIYHIDNTIKIIENLTTNRVTTDIFKADNIIQLVVNENGDKIYFIGQVNGTTGLFELKIQ